MGSVKKKKKNGQHWEASVTSTASGLGESTKRLPVLKGDNHSETVVLKRFTVSAEPPGRELISFYRASPVGLAI